MNTTPIASDDLAGLMANRRTIPPGEVIFLEGQTADCAFIILRGEVQVMVEGPKGNPLLINTMNAGEIFGEIALLQDGKRTATAVSKGGCELLVIDKGVFAKRLADSDPFLRYVIEHLCRLILLWTDRARSA